MRHAISSCCLLVASCGWRWSTNRATSSAPSRTTMPTPHAPRAQLSVAGLICPWDDGRPGSGVLGSHLAVMQDHLDEVLEQPVGDRVVLGILIPVPLPELVSKLVVAETQLLE